jgi:hypothetical protein
VGRFGQRCGEIQVKVRANLEVDLNSRLLEAQKHAKHLEHMLSVLEEEQAVAKEALEEKTAALDAINDKNTRPISVAEEHVCQAVASRIADAMRNDWDENSLHPSARSVIAHELSGMRSPMITEVVSLLVTQASAMVKASNRASLQFKQALNRHLMNRELSMSSMDSKDDEYFGNIFRPEESPSTIETSRDSHLPPQTQARAHLERSGSLDPSVKSGCGGGATATERPHVEPLPSYNSSTSVVSIGHNAGTVGVARKAKMLVDGATVISHGSYGNYKVKYCYVSKDLQMIYWKDMFEKKEPKMMRIDECEK